MTESVPAEVPLALARRRRLALPLLSLAAVASLVYALSTGSVPVGWHGLLAAFHGDTSDTAARIVLELRLPRVLSGFIVGGMLALAGVLMQVLLRNPLAEPYLLGVSGGASGFALCAISLGLGGAWISTAAFAGALATILLVFALARRGGEWSPMRVLLTGVVVASGWGAFVSFMLSVSPASQVKGMLYWLMGDLGYARYSHWNLALLLAGLAASLAGARALNLMVRGDLQAAALGVGVARARIVVYFFASLLTAAAVMQAGSIGFIGLVVPHAVRLLLGGDHRLLLPVSVLCGGGLLVVADTLARTLIAPQQLPVGILTALLGVPVFLLLLRTTAARQHP